MAWIESHQGLARHIKIKRFARKLGITIPSAIGHLHLLWWWAMDNLPDGNLSVVEHEDIADEMMYEGDETDLVNALLASGFLDELDGSLFIHDWHDYIGRLIDKRKADTERKRKNRAISKDVTQESDGCPAGQDAEGSEDGARNRTVPNSTLPSNKKSSRFTPPTLSEIESYISEKGLNVDGKRFFDYFTEGNWIDAKGNKVKNWKQKLLTWSSKNSGNGQAQPVRPEPKYGVHEMTQEELELMPRG